MKKLALMAVAAIAMMTVVSCGEKSPKADLKSNVDSLSYAIGITQTQGLNQYLSQQLGIDTANVDDFIKGVIEGANAGDDKKQAAYYAGIQIGQQISNQMIKGINYQFFEQQGDTVTKVSLKNFLAGFIGALKGKNTMTLKQAGDYVQSAFAKAQASQMEKQKAAQKEQMAKMSKEMEKKYGDWKKQNEAWLAENGKKEGVVKLADGVQYKVIKAGSGAKPQATSTVKVNYTLKTIDGKTIDSNAGKEPVTFQLSGVVPGFAEGVEQMNPGSTYEIYVPQDQGYGPQEQGNMKPFSTLIFTVELIDVK